MKIATQYYFSGITETNIKHSWQIVKNSRDSFVELTSQKDCKQNQTKMKFRLFIENLYNLLLLLLDDLK